MPGQRWHSTCFKDHRIDCFRNRALQKRECIHGNCRNVKALYSLPMYATDLVDRSPPRKAEQVRSNELAHVETT